MVKMSRLLGGTETRERRSRFVEMQTWGKYQFTKSESYLTMHRGGQLFPERITSKRGKQLGAIVPSREKVVRKVLPTAQKRVRASLAALGRGKQAGLSGEMPRRASTGKDSAAQNDRASLGLEHCTETSRRRISPTGRCNLYFATQQNCQHENRRPNIHSVERVAPGLYGRDVGRHKVEERDHGCTPDLASFDIKLSIASKRAELTGFGEDAQPPIIPRE